MLRVVLDTNILVAAAYAPHSASRQILESCLCGEITAILSPAMRREYDHILEQAVRVHGYDLSLRRFLDEAEWVEPDETPRVVVDDPDDDKLLAAAVAGQADCLVTNDRHLLELDPYGSVHIIRPGEFIRANKDHRR